MAKQNHGLNAAAWVGITVGIAVAAPSAIRAQVQADVQVESVGNALLRAYPEQLMALEGAGADAVLLWKDGTRMPLGAGVEKSVMDWATNPDLGDILRFPYPVGPIEVPPQRDHDPGRARPKAFFQKMYGDCSKAEVTAHLVDVIWLPSKSGRKLQVTRINGVAQRLQAISLALDALPASFDVFLMPSAGTYACRPIAGTYNPSAHGFGIAIDVALRRAHYWRWRPGGVAAYRNEIPQEIVRIFEAHGFIWGGKWWHYDTMHFEYRPELLPPAAPLLPPG
jgi:D-alanyl-D-alanine carboxypeptidase